MRAELVALLHTRIPAGCVHLQVILCEGSSHSRLHTRPVCSVLQSLFLQVGIGSLCGCRADGLASPRLCTAWCIALLRCTLG